MINPRHLLVHVVRPVLAELATTGGTGWDSPGAERLMMGTAAAESGLRHLEQLGGGPARGIWQMEPATFTWLADDWLGDRRKIRSVVIGYRLTFFRGRGWDADEVAGNLYLACAMARCRYRAVPEPLPAAEDLHSLAGYWKIHYNTAGGKGQPQEFVEALREILPQLAGA